VSDVAWQGRRRLRSWGDVSRQFFSCIDARERWNTSKQQVSERSPVIPPRDTCRHFTILLFMTRAADLTASPPSLERFKTGGVSLIPPSAPAATRPLPPQFTHLPGWGFASSWDVRRFSACCRGAFTRGCTSRAFETAWGGRKDSRKCWRPTGRRWGMQACRQAGRLKTSGWRGRTSGGGWDR